MPRTAAAKGRPDYPAMMDARWRDSAQRPVHQQFVARAVVREADTLGEYDETIHGKTRTPGAVVYDGMARLLPIGAVGATPDNAGQTVTLRGYRLSVPFPGVAFRPGQKVTFVSGDPVLDARHLTVMASQDATIRLQTDVLIQDDEG